MTKAWPIVEVFGPTVQGEGRMAGRLTHFIRMGGCDYQCAWCDSPMAVLPEEVRKAPKMSAGDVIVALNELPPFSGWVTISGGNPVLHDLTQLVLPLRSRNWAVAVETQGTVFKDWLHHADFVTISPKPPSSGNATSIATLTQFRSKLGAQPNCIKVVVFDKEDMEYARGVRKTFPGSDFYLSVGTYMGGLDGTFQGGQIDTRDDILDRYARVIQWALEDDTFARSAILPQLHAVLWGHGRGF